MQGDKALNFTKPYELRLGVRRSGYALIAFFFIFLPIAQVIVQ
jgi:hypothetical protein